MAAYSSLASQRPTAAPWHFVTTRSQAELQPILTPTVRPWTKRKTRSTQPATESHPAGLPHRPRGNIRNIYSSGTLDPRLVLADVRTLMMESAQASKKPLTPQVSDNTTTSK
jgi:hypothetical protein